MAALSAVAVLVAAAAGLGYFEREPDRPEATDHGHLPLPTAVSIAEQRQPPYLTVTYVLVSSEAEREVWNNVEETINQRELLSSMALEVLVVTNEAQEEAAYEQVAMLRERYPWNRYIVEDHR